MHDRSDRRSNAPSLRVGLVGHHVGPIAPPFVGGVESFTYYLAGWLARAGHDVTLFALPGSRVPGVTVRELDLDLPLSPRARADVSMPPAAFMEAHQAYQGLMMELMGGEPSLDVLHLHSLHYLPVLMSELLPCPTMLTLHTPPTPWLEAALRTRRGGAPDLVAVSMVTAQLWADVAGPVEVIGNGIDLDRWPRGPGGTDAVWSGRIVCEKAPHLAIDAARSAGIALNLAGPISDRRYFAEEIEPRLADDVRYVGHLGHGALKDLMGRSAVAVVSSMWAEPFGLVAAEAMAVGTPVAAFGSGALVDVIDGRSGRIAPAGDVEALGAAMLAAARLERADVRRSARRFDLDVMGESYERRYEALLAERLDDDVSRSLQAA